ncbi:MAG TPA: hypothetical protein VIC27_11085 [Ktedonobacterales bacterium]
MTINTRSGPSAEVDELTARKLAAFTRVEEEFAASFIFVQDVHGQRRFTSFPLASTVRYLHALYICEQKDLLLSILRTTGRYEGERCLQLLRGWQEGQTADVVAFIHRKLDHQPFADVSRQLEQAASVGDSRAARRLASGRIVLLNRNFTLSHALDAIFALEPERLRAEVSALCAQAGHTPDEVNRQIAELRSDIFTYAPTAPLARRNMLVMNRLGAHIVDAKGDRPGQRTDRVAAPATPAPPYAEETIPGEMTLVSLNWMGARRSVTAPGYALGYAPRAGEAAEPLPGPAADAADTAPAADA